MEWIGVFFPYLDWKHAWWFDLLGALFLVAFCDRDRPWSMRNLDLLMMCAWVPLGDYEKGPQRIMTALSYLPLVYFWFRLLWLIRTPPVPSPTPNLTHRVLTGLSIVFLAYNAALIFTAPYPFGVVEEREYHLSESSLMGVRGAEQILSGQPPYGNLDVPRDGAMPYGPAYFLWFVPATALFGVGHLYSGYAPAARVTTLGLLLLAFWLARRLGGRVGGDTTRAAFGFAWTVLPYSQLASYWSWTGNLVPGVMALLGLNALLSRRPVPIAAAVAGAGATSWLGFAYVPVWLFGVERGRRRTYWLAALGISAALVALGMLQADGPARLWSDVSKYILPSKIPAYRNKYSPFTYHEWARIIRIVALLAVVPAVTWILHRLYRAAEVSIFTLAAATALLTVHGQLLVSHAPGRMTLWVLPLYLVVFVAGGARSTHRGGPDTMNGPLG